MGLGAVEPGEADGVEDLRDGLQLVHGGGGVELDVLLFRQGSGRLGGEAAGARWNAVFLVRVLVVVLERRQVLIILVRVLSCGGRCTVGVASVARALAALRVGAVLRLEVVHGGRCSRYAGCTHHRCR